MGLFLQSAFQPALGFVGTPGAPTLHQVEEGSV